MAAKTRSELNSDADTNLADNTSGDITAADVRTLVKDIADSALLPEDPVPTHSHSSANTSTAGFMTSSDKSKLDGIATGATKVTVTISTSDPSGGSDGDIWFKVAP